MCQCNYPGSAYNTKSCERVLGAFSNGKLLKKNAPGTGHITFGLNCLDRCRKAIILALS